MLLVGLVGAVEVGGVWVVLVFMVRCVVGRSLPAAIADVMSGVLEDDGSSSLWNVT